MRFYQHAAKLKTLPRAERASRLRELDLAVVVDDPETSAASLASAIDAAGSKNDWGRWNFDCDGAARSASIIVEMLASVGMQR